LETVTVILGIQDQRIYAAATNKTNGGNGGTGVYMSTDCGASWTAQTTGTNSDKLLSGAQWAMMIDPRDPAVIYTANGYGNDPTLYKSTNAGVDFAQLTPYPGKGVQVMVQAIAIDPGNPDHIAVTFHDNCTSPWNGLCLSYSNDAGATWNLFNGPSALSGWQEAASMAVLGPTSYLYTGNGAWYTDDSGASWDKVGDALFAGSYNGSMLFADGKLFMGGASLVMESTSEPLGSSFTTISGSTSMTTMTSDGTKLYGGNLWNYGGNPMYSAPLDDLSSFSHNTTAPNMGRGPAQMAYDPVHHIIYSASMVAGLWRMVTE
jgi:hypothetical protein